MHTGRRWIHSAFLECSSFPKHVTACMRVLQSCAVAMHEFQGKCYNAVNAILGDDERSHTIEVRSIVAQTNAVTNGLILKSVANAICRCSKTFASPQ
jgi:hypothetical protein